MEKQDTEESDTQGPPSAGGIDSPAAVKHGSDSNSSKESEPHTPQTETPPQSDEGGAEGKIQNFKIFTTSTIMKIIDTYTTD